jgi:hypothetical protein
MNKRINAYLVIFSLATVLALATASECHSITHLPSLLYGVELWGWWGLVASALWWRGKRSDSAKLPPGAIVVQLLAASLLGILHLLLLNGSSVSLGDINRLGLDVLIYGFVFGITGVIQFQIRAQRDAMQALSLQRQLSTAHLRALQMQMEPHFLFNTLNAITTLVELGRQDEAARMLRNLNCILKSTLTRDTPQKVPLSQELELVENYLAIEQVRFADRLRVQIKIDPRAVDGMVPCFLLQPIVENAIRHGIAHCESEGVVEASARREGDLLHFSVRDTGAGGAVAKENGHGIGLKNTRERLEHFYADGYQMRAQPLHSGGFEVAITIPYERVAV